VNCGANELHKYGGHLAACPWCERKQLLGGRDPFPMGRRSEDLPIHRVPASSLLPRARALAPQPAARAPGGSPGSATAISPPSWQSSQPLSASVSGGLAGALPAATLFSYRLSGSGWAWGALFWTLLAVASVPLAWWACTGSRRCSHWAAAVAGWRAGAKRDGLTRWVGAVAAVAACSSLAFRPFMAAPMAGAAAFKANSGSVRSLSFSADGSRLAAGTNRLEDASLTEGEVNIWDVASSRLLLTPAKASGDVVSVRSRRTGRRPWPPPIRRSAPARSSW